MGDDIYCGSLHCATIDAGAHGVFTWTAVARVYVRVGGPVVRGTIYRIIFALLSRQGIFAFDSANFVMLDFCIFSMGVCKNSRGDINDYFF